ncbi:MAG: PIN domain-containing protein [Nitrospirae bacterium]|nr:PIN domain-containing protein [Nitrospirota bacterium]
MGDKVLIDTSVWVDFFRKRRPELIERIATLLKSGRAFCTGIIALELLNGAKGPKELKALHDAFDIMRHIAADETTCMSAGKLGYEIARKGHTMSTVDLLIAQVAIENSLSLMTFDEHFDTIAKNSELTLFK